jgi:uncharacterized protein (TIGR00369 family)
MKRSSSELAHCANTSPAKITNKNRIFPALAAIHTMSARQPKMENAHMNDPDAAEKPPAGPVVIKDGPFRGWSTWSSGADPFETAIGPFVFRVDDGKVRCAFQPKPEHLNGGGTIHGGALMSFADFSLFAIAHNALRDAKAVTLTCNSEFLAAGDLNGFVEAEGEVLRETRSLIFVRGLISQVSRPLLAFSGTLKKISAVTRK